MAEKRVPVINSVNETREIALNGIAYTENTELKEKYTKKINEEFGEILVNVEKSENIKEIDSYTNEASNLKSKLLNSFDKQEAETIKIKLEMEKKTRQNPESLEEIKIKKPKRIGISEINKDRVWEVRNTDDINSYLDKLKKRLEEELEDSEIVQVEF